MCVLCVNRSTSNIAFQYRIKCSLSLECVCVCCLYVWGMLLFLGDWLPSRWHALYIERDGMVCVQCRFKPFKQTIHWIALLDISMLHIDVCVWTTYHCYSQLPCIGLFPIQCVCITLLYISFFDSYEIQITHLLLFAFSISLLFRERVIYDD